jgi:hypothetical protein
VNQKQRLAVLNGQLRNHTNSSKHITVLNHVIAKDLSQNTPLLESFVHSFLTKISPTWPLPPFPLAQSNSLGMSLSMVPHLNTHHQPQPAHLDLTMLQVSHKKIWDHCKLLVTKVHKSSKCHRQDQNSYLIMKAWPLELVGIPIFGGLGPLKICPVHTQKAVIVDIFLKPSLE